MAVESLAYAAIRTACSLILLFGCAGCAFHQPATPSTHQPQTVDDALARVLAIEEVRTADAFIRRKSGGMSHGTVMADSATPVGHDGRRYWQVAFVESTPDHTHRWWTFVVDVDSGTVLAEDTVEDSRLDLEAWRIKEKPLQNLTHD